LSNSAIEKAFNPLEIKEDPTIEIECESFEIKQDPEDPNNFEVWANNEKIEGELVAYTFGSTLDDLSFEVTIVKSRMRNEKEDEKYPNQLSIEWLEVYSPKKLLLSRL
jgi:hypothetical protein